MRPVEREPEGPVAFREQRDRPGDGGVRDARRRPARSRYRARHRGAIVAVSTDSRISTRTTARGFWPTDALTVAAWVRATGQLGESGTIVSKPAQYRIARYPDGTLRWAFNQDGMLAWVNTGVVIPGNTWTHVAVAYDHGLVKTYVNGRLAHAQQLTGTLTAGPNPSASMTIGGRADLVARLPRLARRAAGVWRRPERGRDRRDRARRQRHAVRARRDDDDGQRPVARRLRVAVPGDRDAAQQRGAPAGREADHDQVVCLARGQLRRRGERDHRQRRAGAACSCRCRRPPPSACTTPA